jgi:hypothetical protein
MMVVKKFVSLIVAIIMMYISSPFAYAAQDPVFSIDYNSFALGEKFSEGLTVIKVNDKYGYMDKTGSQVIKPQFDKAGLFSEGYAKVMINGKWGYINKSGEVVIQPKYSFAGDFSEGLANVLDIGSGNRMGFIDKNGREVIKLPEYVAALDKFSEGLNRIMVFESTQPGNKSGFIDITGKEVIKPEYSDALPFRDGLAGVKIGSLWGFIDKKGSVVVEPQYDEVKSFSEGLASVKINGKYGFIDKTGDIIIEPVYDSSESFSEGLVLVKAQEKYGYIDHAGNEIIKPQYELAYSFSEGLAAVSIKKPVTWAFVDKTGEEIIRLDRVFAGENLKFTEGMAPVTTFNTLGGEVVAGYILHPMYPQLPMNSAAPLSSKVILDGKEMEFEAYNIDGNNYFKLRDLAAAVAGSSKQFEVGWDDTKNVISIEINKAYTFVGGELARSSDQIPQNALPTDSKISLNGKELQITAFHINGNNYFKLRDIAKIINFGVSWDASKNRIGISTMSVYEDEL